MQAVFFVMSLALGQSLAQRVALSSSGEVGSCLWRRLTGLTSPASGGLSCVMWDKPAAPAPKMPFPTLLGAHPASGGGGATILASLPTTSAVSIPLSCGLVLWRWTLSWHPKICRVA